MMRKNRKKSERMNKEIEKTVSDICDWIREELKNTSGSHTESILPEIIRALADLVRALKTGEL